MAENEGMTGPVQTHAAATGSGAPQHNDNLSRTLRPLGAWSLAIGCIVGWGAFVMPADSFLPTAGPLGTALGFGVGAIIMSLIAHNYGYLAKTHEHTNGMYGYVRSAFGPSHAFVCAWCLILVYTAAIAANATAMAVIARSIIGKALQFGFHYNIAGYEVYFGEVLSAVALIVAAGSIVAFGMRVAGRLQTVLALGMLAGFVILTVMAITRPGFSFDRVKPFFGTEGTPLSGTLAIITIAPWAYVGFESVCQSADECRFHTGKFGRIMIWAVVLGGLCYTLLNFVTATAIPARFDSWASYLARIPELSGLEALPTLNACYLIGGQTGLVIAEITALCAVLTGVIGFLLAASRLAFALSQEGTISKRMSHVSERYGTPVAATLAISIVAVVGTFFGRTVLGWFVDLLSLGSLVAYIYASLATIKQAQEQGNKRMQVLGGMGVVLTLMFVALLLIPGIGSSPSQESYIILVTWIALGVNYYKPTVER